MMRTLSIALLSAALLSVPAAAQDAAVEYYSDDADVAVEATDEAPAVIEEDAAAVVEDDAPAPRYRTRVYGFTAVAPANCGVFKYWNGERCADARDEPPALD